VLARGDGSYTIQQQSTSRFMDAHEGSHDNSVVTRDFQANATQGWIIEPKGASTGPIVPSLFGEFYIQQQSNMRFMDAHEGSNDNSVVTRNFQANDTQKWIFEEVGRDVYTIREKSNGRYLDAHEGSHDNDAVTRDNQGNSTQQWIVKRVSGGVYTIQQRSNGRYLDAHEGINGHAVVTRDRQNNQTQLWVLRSAR
jgi:hypothetical protein